MCQICAKRFLDSNFNKAGAQLPQISQNLENRNLKSIIKKGYINQLRLPYKMTGTSKESTFFGISEPLIVLLNDKLTVTVCVLL